MIANSHCPECGYNFAAFGRVHRCIPRVAKPAVNPVPAVAATVSVAGGEEFSDAARTIGVGPAVSAHGAAGTYDRYRDKDRRRAYMRDYMRKRRGR